MQYLIDNALNFNVSIVGTTTLIKKYFYTI